MSIKANRIEPRKITRKELMDILVTHPHSEQYRLDLPDVDLSGEDLSRLDLSNIIFRNANLSDTIIKYSTLYNSDLSGANLSYAAVISSNLNSADLSMSNLKRALFYNTDLSPALIDMSTMDKYFPLVCPSEGEFIGWKKAITMEKADIFHKVYTDKFHRVIVKLLIPSDARRSSAFGRKCRCDKATVLGIESLDDFHADIAFSTYNMDFKYELGKEVMVKDFDTDRRHECAPGIHFFMTHEEAVAFSNGTCNNIAINIENK